MSDYSSMTPEEVRCAIAERKGYKWALTDGPEETFWRDPTATLQMWTYEKDGQTYYTDTLPNWPKDANAALALCLELARSRGDWALVLTPDGDPECGEWWSAHFDAGPLPKRIHLVYDTTPALALCRLWLAAGKLQPDPIDCETNDVDDLDDDAVLWTGFDS